MLKFKKEIKENLDSPKNVHTIEADKIAEKYCRITAEKGQTGLSQFYSITHQFEGIFDKDVR